MRSFPPLLLCALLAACGPWGADQRKATAANAPVTASQGCKFAGRCPFVMDECRVKAPPLYRTAEDRAVACYLYKDTEQVEGKAMAEYMAA